MKCRASSLLSVALRLFFTAVFAFGAPGSETNQPQPTWEPPQIQQNGKLTAARLKQLPPSAFAFPRVRKEPITDAAHVRSAIARFRQVKGVTDAERDLAFANIQKAARHFGVKMKETDWHQIGLRSHTPNSRQQPR